MYYEDYRKGEHSCPKERSFCADSPAITCFTKAASIDGCGVIRPALKGYGALVEEWRNQMDKKMENYMETGFALI